MTISQFLDPTWNALSSARRVEIHDVDHLGWYVVFNIRHLYR